MLTPHAKLAKTLKAELLRVRDVTKAPGMQAYMKSEMPYLGVTAPLMRAACKKVFAGLTIASDAEFQETTLGLWRGARFREERYAAIELTGHKCARAFQVPAALPMYEEMIVDGAWWDYVDAIAIHRLGPIVAARPSPMKKKMLAWSRSRDLWKRRSAILCQITFKKETDLDLLYACIAPAMKEREFFLRKAIGWALRQYAWTDPAEVTRFVRAHKDELSPLSKREALKNIS